MGKASRVSIKGIVSYDMGLKLDLLKIVHSISSRKKGRAFTVSFAVELSSVVSMNGITPVLEVQKLKKDLCFVEAEKLFTIWRRENFSPKERAFVHEIVQRGF